MAKSRVNKTDEAAIEKYLVKSIENLGGIAWKFTAPKVRGVPDRIILIKDLIFFVELKKTGEHLRALQLWRKIQLQDQGFTVLVIDSINKVDELIENIVGGKHEQLRNYIQFCKF